MSTTEATQDSTNAAIINYSVHEGIIFAIELTDTLLLPIAGQGKSHLELILESLQQSMSHSIITLPNTGYGLYFFNSAKTSEGLSEGIERVFPVTDLNVKVMKYVYDLMEENKVTSELYSPINERFKPSEEKGKNPLYHLFLTLRDDLLMKKEGQKLYNNMKVFLFTDNDVPVVDDVNEKNLLRKVYNDLDDIHINITCMFLNSGAGFDRTLYSELLKIEYEDEDDSEGDDDANGNEYFHGSNTKPIKVEDIKDRIIRGKEIKRKLFEVPLIFNDNLIIGIKGYTIFSEQKRSKHKNLYEGPNFVKNVHVETRLIGSEKSNHAGEEITETIKVYEFGDITNPEFKSTDIIPIDPTQESQLQDYNTTKTKDSMPSFLKLLGFKPSDYGLKFAQNMSTSPFVTPNEAIYKGSTRTLSALYQSLKKQDKVAILFGKLRSVSAPAYYALQTSKQPQFPEGFFLVRLPYLDELRNFPGVDDWGLNVDIDSDTNLTYEKMKSYTKSILQAFVIKGDKPYDPKDYKNPSLNRHFKIIQDYVLQINQDLDDPSLPEEVKQQREVQRRLQEDDTLRAVMSVRRKIEESILGRSGDQGRLSEELKGWNDLYNRFS